MRDSSKVDCNYKWLPIEPLPLNQALSSGTFQPPPLDGSLTLPEIYDWHLEHSPEHQLFAYTDSFGIEHEVNWRDGARGIFNVSREIRRCVRLPANRIGSPPTVVAILSTAGNRTYDFRLLHL